MNHIEYCKQHRVLTEAIKMTMTNYGCNRKRAIETINELEAGSWFEFKISTKGIEFWWKFHLALVEYDRVKDIEVNDAESVTQNVEP